jgi:primosomal protein N' (replication factor Y)
VDRGIAEIKTETKPSPLDGLEAEVKRLNNDQESALEQIGEDLAAGAFSPILLQGVTGSGKTELYLRAARAVIDSGGGCIVLVPEIGLLPQATSRYRRVFGDNIAILHSRLTGAERFRIWERIQRGEHRVVLGPRSAVFSPVRNLRLIVVDEEQDDSYKQDDKPRYHARNVALMRGKFENATVIMGSATPSAESLHHARGGLYRHLKLPSRVKGASLPSVRIIDMRKAELNGAFFSSVLLEHLENNLDAGHQAILFLNKRGHARYVQCNACGWVARCENCDISLTYHRIRNRLRCHFCGYDRKSVTRCDQCGSARLYFSGVGTQRVELDLEAFFPGVGILRMDADTTSGKDGHRRVLEQFSSGDYRILIGTQMVTKGHHFPRVNLVGVLFGEESLHYPDFRSSEKTFQQLIQVSGRSGRDSNRGEVIVQTYMPEHYVFGYLETHDYDGFMTEELSVRNGLSYPPFSRIILASCSAPKEPLVSTVINAWAARIEPMLANSPVQVLGPVQPVVARIKNRYREQLLIRGQISRQDKARILNAYGEVAERIKGGRGVELRWDVDPEAFL